MRTIIAIIMLVTACKAKPVPYESIPRTIILTPVTVEWYGASPHGTHCEEVEPCWDCTTMGNRICGKVHGSGTGKGNSNGEGRGDGYGNKRQNHLGL